MPRNPCADPHISKAHHGTHPLVNLPLKSFKEEWTIKSKLLISQTGMYIGSSLFARVADLYTSCRGIYGANFRACAHQFSSL